MPFSQLPSIFFSLENDRSRRVAPPPPPPPATSVFVADRIRVAFGRNSELNGSMRISHCASHVTRHASHVTRRASQMALGRWLLRTLTACTGGVAGGARLALSSAFHHTSHVTRHTSHVTRHTSHVTRHTSHVTRHTSHVTRHTSRSDCSGLQR
jgi:hypothetical protein